MAIKKIKRRGLESTFEPDFDLSRLRPASYNPRRITPEAQTRLRESLGKLGCVKPIIVNGETKVIVAGHQRTSQMIALGWRTAPAVVLPTASAQDEINFNMYHNAVEYQHSVVYVKNPQSFPLKGYKYAPWEDINIIENNNPVYAYEQAQLFTLYGNWGSCVMTQSGKIIHNAEWAIVCFRYRQPLLCYTIQDDEENLFKHYLSQEYGEYAFEHLKIDHSYQFKAQPNRAGKLAGSILYEKFVLSSRYGTAKPEHRILDFGSGRCITPERINRIGYNILPYEPFIRANKKLLAIDIQATVKQIHRIRLSLLTNKQLFDRVVCEAVLNSVISKEYERYVLITLNAFCSTTGAVLLSTRNIDYENKVMTADKVTENRRRRKVHFMTKDNVEVSFRRNDSKFLVQMYHNKKSLHELLSKYFETVYIWGEKNSYLYARCENPIPQPENAYIRALSEEFNMPYPQDYRHNQHRPLLAVILPMLKKRDADIMANGYPESDYKPPKKRKASSKPRKKRRARNDVAIGVKPKDNPTE